MHPDPDRALVEAAAAGDADAFGALVARHQARIVNLARAMTADAGEAEDLAQETFLRAYKALGSFRGDSSFGTWLHRVAVNVIQTHLKSRTRRWRLWGWSQDPRTDDDPVERASDDEPRASGHLEDDVAMRQIIDQALRTLPPDMRLAVTLRDVQGFEYAEIAAMLGVPIGTVESRIFRGRQRLRPLLAPLIDRGFNVGER